MRCPHCTVAYHENPFSDFITEDIDGGWEVVTAKCPECKHATMVLRNGVMGPKTQGMHLREDEIASVTLIHPKTMSRKPLPTEVPGDLQALYREAAEVLTASPRASAALSRRALQQLLREHGGAMQHDLFDQIEHVIEKGGLPSGLQKDIDAVRTIGNMAAHPQKSKVTGEIVEVEPGEAEWNLDVLDGLFDFYFVLPAQQKARRDAHNERLASIGKPPLR